MELNIVSYNVRGLSTKSSKIHLRTFLHVQHFNVCFLHEHKRRQAELPLLGKNVWKGHFFTTAA